MALPARSSSAGKSPSSKCVSTARRVSSSSSNRIDRSDRVFCSPRRVHFLEMEYGIPFDVVPEALERVGELVASLPFPPLFPIEVRASAADDIPCAVTANGLTFVLDGASGVEVVAGVAPADVVTSLGADR